MDFKLEIYKNECAKCRTENAKKSKGLMSGRAEKVWLIPSEGLRVEDVATDRKSSLILLNLDYTNKTVTY